MNDAFVMRMWRDAGLPEYFLGNGGTNDKLVVFAELISAEMRERAAKTAENPRFIQARDDAWDDGVNYMRHVASHAIRMLPLVPEESV